MKNNKIVNNNSSIRSFRKQWLTKTYINYPKNVGKVKFFDIYKRFKLKLINKKRLKIQLSARRMQARKYFKSFSRSKKNPRKKGDVYLFYKKTTTIYFLP